MYISSKTIHRGERGIPWRYFSGLIVVLDLSRFGELTLLSASTSTVEREVRVFVIEL